MATMTVKCKICKKGIESGEEYKMDCSHKYHSKCIGEWHNKNRYSKSCPECTTEAIAFCSVEGTLSEFACIIEHKVHSRWKKIILANLATPEKDCLRYYEKNTCYPPKNDIFNWAISDPAEIKVVIIGQDPYINEGQAHGYSFSVRDGIKVPPSLKNIYKAIEYDLNEKVNFPNSGNLTGWANQGVLLLNASLTVMKGKSNSHASTWSAFTKNIIKWLVKEHKNMVFLLWGNFAQQKEKLLKDTDNLILKNGHPSPLNTMHKFVGTKCFSQTNEYLISKGRGPIDWVNHLP